MPSPLDQITKIGADRTYQDPNDPALTGTYKCPVSDLTAEQKSPLVNFPMAPAPSPFVIKGG